MGRVSAEVLGRRSPLLCRLSGVYVRRYVRRHFHALRVARAGPLPVGLSGPLFVVVNHPSWWDPLVGFLLAAHLGRVPFVPMAAAGLARYPLLERLGVFGLPAGVAGSRRFLEVGRLVLHTPGTVLVVTPQGRFADPRERPVRLMPGIGHLTRSLGAGTLLPVALEYAFWNERLPEALVHCGRPIPLGSGRSVADWTAQAAAGLTAAQDALAVEAVSRDPARFETLVGGRAGVGGVYDVWRRIAARVRGRSFDPRHMPEAGG